METECAYFACYTLYIAPQSLWLPIFASFIVFALPICILILQDLSILKAVFCF